MEAFIDDFNLIRVESQTYIHQISIHDDKLTWIKNEAGHQFFKTKKEINLHLDDCIVINHKTYPLRIGYITLTKGFNDRFQYDGPLGYHYTKDATSFYLFSPVAKEINVVVDDKKYPMTYASPVWHVTLPGNHEHKVYYYEVRLTDTFDIADDPYGFSSNHEHTQIIDMDKTYQMKHKHVKLKQATDAVIYEGHIRDLTINLDILDKGLYQGLTQHSKYLNNSVIKHIKHLGITHLQLLPVQDFLGVDDFNKADFYNWGYNPQNYFSLDGWYSKNPKDAYDRINAFKKLVDDAHAHQLGINIDVVYNHVFKRGLYPYDKIVPGYFFRHDKKGKQTDSSLVGNDIETTNYMVRRLIIDSLIFFVKHYRIDGFRFDLMGLLDVETMLLIEKALRKINQSVMIYGEGWNIDNALPKNMRSNMKNQHLMPSIGHFNDSYRNNVKGMIYTQELGYATGSKQHTMQAIAALKGSPELFKKPTQSINFVECHDNMTLFDKLAFNYQDEQTKRIYQDFANHLIAVSQGIPFYHAGQEMYRSKSGDRNSYRSPDSVNGINWILGAHISQFRKILSIRKKYSVYRSPSYQNITIEQLDNYIYYRLKDHDIKLIHYIKNDFKRTTLPEGKYIFTSQKTYKKHGFVYADKPGVYILKK